MYNSLDLTSCIRVMELVKMRDCYEQVIKCDHSCAFRKEAQDRLDFINSKLNTLEG